MHNYVGYANEHDRRPRAGTGSCHRMYHGPVAVRSIAAMDAAWEEAYNHCRMKAMDSIISEDLEFYHDQGGVVTSKQAILDALQKNICGKVSRQLKPSSIEVYPIANFGAIVNGAARVP